MATTIYCKYCHHNWKPGIEYDKHIRCCEYFYQQRRTPSQPEMTETGTPLPNIRQLYRYIQDLTYRLEKTEKELKKLKNVVNCRQKRAIIEWLNQPNQIPTVTFEEWLRTINACESDMMKVLNGDLTDGVLSCLNTIIQRYNTEQTKKSLPIRCFSQKPDTFYVYSIKPVKETQDNTESPTVEWQRMSTEQLLKLANCISKSLFREFSVWNTAQFCSINIKDGNYDQNFMDTMPRYVKKLNSDVGKTIPEMKKTMFSKLEENLRIVMECDFE